MKLFIALGLVAYCLALPIDTDDNDAINQAIIGASSKEEFFQQIKPEIEKLMGKTMNEIHDQLKTMLAQKITDSDKLAQITDSMDFNQAQLVTNVEAIAASPSFEVIHSEANAIAELLHNGDLTLAQFIQQAREQLKSAKDKIQETSASNPQLKADIKQALLKDLRLPQGTQQ